jgi:hypothetical protein
LNPDIITEDFNQGLDTLAISVTLPTVARFSQFLKKHLGRLSLLYSATIHTIDDNARLLKTYAAFIDILNIAVKPLQTANGEGLQIYTSYQIVSNLVSSINELMANLHKLIDQCKGIKGVNSFGREASDTTRWDQEGTQGSRFAPLRLSDRRTFV